MHSSESHTARTYRVIYHPCYIFLHNEGGTHITKRSLWQDPHLGQIADLHPRVVCYVLDHPCYTVHCSLRATPEVGCATVRGCEDCANEQVAAMSSTDFPGSGYASKLQLATYTKHLARRRFHGADFAQYLISVSRQALV